MKEERAKWLNNSIRVTVGFDLSGVPEDLGEELSKSFEDDIKQKGLAYGQIEVVVSNSAIDRHGESITMEGIDLKQMKKNPVVLWGHDYSGLPIGKATKLWKQDGNLMARIQFATDNYEFANTVYKLILDGVINAVSIGGIVREFGQGKSGETDYSTIAKLEMVEVSVVPVGAHPDALVTAKSLGIDEAQFTKEYEDFARGSLIDKVKALPENEIDLAIKTLQSLVSALQTIKSAEPEPVTDRRVLVRLRSTAKLTDKAAEKLIAGINYQLNNK